jgi:penicillin-binding protein 1A
VFANGGNRVTPWHLLKVTDKDGRVLENFSPPPASPAIDPRNAFITTSLMQDVIRRGTATGALKLGRGDLAGKTGTTNEHHDAWFAGFQATRVAVAWLGYDQPRPLGSGETGGGTALPIWVRYMGEALKSTPEMPPAMPTPVGRASWYTTWTAPVGRARPGGRRHTGVFLPGVKARLVLFSKPPIPRSRASLIPVTTWESRSQRGRPS